MATRLELAESDMLNWLFPVACCAVFRLKVLYHPQFLSSTRNKSLIERPPHFRLAIEAQEEILRGPFKEVPITTRTRHLLHLSPKHISSVGRCE